MISEILGKRKKKHFSKKGTLKLMTATTMELMFLALVLGAFLSIYIKFSDTSMFEKQFLSRDIALMTDTVQVAPYQAVVKYEIDKSYTAKFETDTDGNRVSVYKDPKESLSYPFSKYTEIPLEASEITPNIRSTSTGVIETGDGESDEESHLKMVIYRDTTVGALGKIPVSSVLSSTSTGDGPRRTGSSSSVVITGDCTSLAEPTVYKGLSALSTQVRKDYFGSSEGEIRQNLCSVTIKSQSMKVHRCALPAFLEVADKVKNINYDIPQYGGSFNWRCKRGTEGNCDLSYHAFGIAVDLNPSANPFSTTFKTDMPKCWVEAWLSSGFEWGGNYHITNPDGKKDAMHFEYVDWYEIPLDEWRKEQCIPLENLPSDVYYLDSSTNTKKLSCSRYIEKIIGG